MQRRFYQVLCFGFEVTKNMWNFIWGVQPGQQYLNLIKIALRMV